MEVHPGPPCLFKRLGGLSVHGRHIRFDCFFELLCDVVNFKEPENCYDSLRFNAKELSVWVDPTGAKCKMKCLFNFRGVTNLACKGAIKWNRNAGSIQLPHAVIYFELCSLADLNQPGHCWVSEDVNDLAGRIGHVILRANT